MEKFITFNNIDKLLKRAINVPETSEDYVEIREIMKLEVTAYNIDRLKELVAKNKKIK